jgi:hypothetical protein
MMITFIAVMYKYHPQVIVFNGKGVSEDLEGVLMVPQSEKCWFEIFVL